MRLIDLDAFREVYDLREHCEDCRRRNKKECDYPSYSARDFCGWLDDVPTIDAVPLKPLCEWLAANALQRNGLAQYAKDLEQDLRKWMREQEEQNGTD